MVERKNVRARAWAEPVVSLTSASPWFDRAGLLPAFGQSLIPMLACSGRSAPFGNDRRSEPMGGGLHSRPSFNDPRPDR